MGGACVWETSDHDCMLSFHTWQLQGLPALTEGEEGRKGEKPAEGQNRNRVTSLPFFSSSFLSLLEYSTFLMVVCVL